MSQGFFNFPAGVKDADLPKIAYSKVSPKIQNRDPGGFLITSYKGSNSFLRYGQSLEYSADYAYTDTLQQQKCATDGELIYSLKDTSGNNLSLTAGGSGVRPAFDNIHTTSTGKCALRLSGIQSMTATTSISTYTVYLIVRPTSGWVSGNPIGFVFLGGSNTIIGLGSSTNQLTVGNSITKMPKITIGNTYMIVFDSQSVGQRVFVKGVDVSTDIIRSNSIGSISTINLGQYAGSGMSGQIYYFSVYNYWQSMSERIKLIGYLNSIYGVWP